MSKRIGILTLFHSNYNWGGVLQGYALKTTLEKLLDKNNMDGTVSILKYCSGYNPIYPTLLKQMQQYNIKEIFSKTTEKFIKKNSSVFERLIENRKKLFREFMISNTNDDIEYNDLMLKSITKQYNCIICGSDQVWNPNVVRPGFLLQGIPDDCVRAAYSASIARDDLSETEKKVIIPALEKFDFISVREKTAKKILDKYMCGNIEVWETLDPAMLLTAEEWRDVSVDCRHNESKYVLCFFFSESYKYRKAIEYYCKKKNLELCFIPFARNKYIKSDDKGKATRLYDIGPKEFLYLFDHAEYIFTDSFHGSIFSLIFKKQFCVFERDKNTKVSKNSRLYDLLDKFEVSDRLIKSTDEIDTVIEKTIDFSKVDNIMSINKEKSINYLYKVIGV